MKILKVDSSTNGGDSVSRELTDMIVEKLKSDNPDADIVTRDLGTEPLAHLNPITTGAIRMGEDDWTDDMKAAAPAEKAILEEFLSADVVVIGAPMYNFTIPSALKSWIDRLGVPRVTFRYSENGPEGLAGGRKIIVASARGGNYGDDSPMDFQESLLETFFNFIGIDDITVIRAEGVGMPEGRKKAMASAKEQIAAL
ncbi:MAG: FMN-dependent NADH-azoreductase [Croceicoccus sp.]|nr:FMN-dependent NADH-azoreductase [Croceicoccus sp.]MAL26457.1 FMN-dependent NADH-azoreductase [Croceicoccus sp.]|tara:strand:- start:34564 stop:35157 length:594 start_codon:yes stop_codon:yes gene_type:complete